MIIPFNQKNYCILKPTVKIFGLDDEALVFVIEEIDGEDCLVIYDDMEIVNKVFDLYYGLLREDGIM